MGASEAVTAAGGVHGFPAALTSFIGRAGPVREVAGLLEQHRLVTVTGPGGVGKTRLAGEMARAVARRFGDGTWLAELAPVRNPAQVPGVVAAALGVRELPGVTAVEVLARVLATSREPLAVTGEARYRLGPLALPSGADPGEAGGSEAVRLFADRARQVDRVSCWTTRPGPW